MSRLLTGSDYSDYSEANEALLELNPVIVSIDALLLATIVQGVTTAITSACIPLWCSLANICMLTACLLADLNREKRTRTPCYKHVFFAGMTKVYLKPYKSGQIVPPHCVGTIQLCYTTGKEFTVIKLLFRMIR